MLFATVVIGPPLAERWVGGRVGGGGGFQPIPTTKRNSLMFYEMHCTLNFPIITMILAKI
jgi:hypothetical protein